MKKEDLLKIKDDFIAKVKKDKKKSIAIGVGALLLVGSAGCGLALYGSLSSDSNGEIVNETYLTKKDSSKKKTTVDSSKDKVSQDKKDDKSDKEKEDAKAEDKKSEDKTEDKKDVTKDISDTSDKGTSGSISSGNSSSSGSSSNSSNSGSGSGNSSRKPSGGNNSGNNKPSHSHSWQPTYSSVKVSDAWTEKVLVKEAWAEEVTETKWYAKCNGCGAKFNTPDEWQVHDKENALQGDFSHGAWTGIDEITVVDVINHPAEYKDVYHDAVYEDKITGYKCSCGATK